MNECGSMSLNSVCYSEATTIPLPAYVSSQSLNQGVAILQYL